MYHKDAVKLTVSQKGPEIYSGMSFQWLVEAARMNGTHGPQEKAVLGKLKFVISDWAL